MVRCTQSFPETYNSVVTTSSIPEDGILPLTNDPSGFVPNNTPNHTTADAGVNGIGQSSLHGEREYETIVSDPYALKLEVKVNPDTAEYAVNNISPEEQGNKRVSDLSPPVTIHNDNLPQSENNSSHPISECTSVNSMENKRSVENIQDIPADFGNKVTSDLGNASPSVCLHGAHSCDHVTNYSDGDEEASNNVTERHSSSDNSLMVQGGDSAYDLTSMISVSSTICQSCVKRYASMERIRGQDSTFSNPAGPPSWREITDILVPDPVDQPISFAPTSSIAETAPSTRDQTVILDIPISVSDVPQQKKEMASSDIGGIVYTGSYSIL